VIIVAYTRRVTDSELAKLLNVAGFILIEGPKAVGKTESAKQIARKIVRLDVDSAARELAQVAPDVLLAGETPVLIDEWQLVPELWSKIKVEVDTRQQLGQFILTGSAIPADDVTRDTGAGRVARLRMRPMSLLETGNSKGTVSVAELFSGKQPGAEDPGLSLSDIVDCICSGGWPAFQRQSVDVSRTAMKNYLAEIAGVDLQRVSGVKYNKANVLKVLKSLARNVGTKASDSVIARDAGTKGNPIDRKTTSGYLESLERVMITENNPPWTPELRSRDRVNASPTRYFIDPSLAVAALGASPSTLLGDQIKYLGFLFENLAVRDLRIYMQSLGGAVYQYRDDAGVEVDVILELGDNSWAAIEVKLGSGQIEEAAKGLRKFKTKINIEACGEPTFMAVLTATGPCYVRKDGIYVLSIGSLCP
jgi:predicted AAA+ superfamily ATPase